MFWIHEPLEPNDIAPRDACVVQVCWDRSGGGACDVRLCITKVCGKNY